MRQRNEVLHHQSLDFHGTPSNLLSFLSRSSPLSSSGLANLHLLGCSEIDISPTISILKRDHPESLCNGQFGDLPTFGCGAVGQLQDRADDREVLCESFSKANLVNLAVLGCSKTKINPTINILKRNEICSSLAESGIDAS